GSMRRALDEMNRRRTTQLAYNVEHRITPRSIVKSVGDIRFATRVADAKVGRKDAGAVRRPADAKEREAMIQLLEQQMQAAARDLDFELAALLRDQLLEIRAEEDGGRRAAHGRRTQPVR
ncbi:MAG TPA: UvrB/UvrC motif-containing protein, partial [Gemmatimonadales bacterium]|nr:UvrB/UvrC motif-containing protein [Gemmatimonadales bacterium]